MTAFAASVDALFGDPNLAREATYETEKLIARAQKAEDNAYVALTVVEASLNDAERMVLEAISAWRDAQAVTVELNGSEDISDALEATLANQVGVSPSESRRF